MIGYAKEATSNTKTVFSALKNIYVRIPRLNSGVAFIRNKGGF